MYIVTMRVTDLKYPGLLFVQYILNYINHYEMEGL